MIIFRSAPFMKEIVNLSLTGRLNMDTIATICFFVYYLLALIDYNFWSERSANTFDLLTKQFKTYSFHDKQALYQIP